MFQTLLAHSQEALHKQRLVYYVRILSVALARAATVPQQNGIIRTQYTKLRLCCAS
jgi:hypothetical protein